MPQAIRCNRCRGTGKEPKNTSINTWDKLDPLTNVLNEASEPCKACGGTGEGVSQYFDEENQ